MAFQLKIEKTTYTLWLGVNAPLLLFEALGLISLDRFLNPDPDSPQELTETEKELLNVANLYHSIKTYASRHAIASILLDEAEFTPALPYATARQLAQNLEILEAVNFVAAVFNDYGEKSKPEAAIAVPELPLAGAIATANIAEGE